MIWIVGGTGETRELIHGLGDIDYVVTVATDEGLDFLPDPAKGLVGRLDYKQMVDLVRKNKIQLIADISHPFASQVSGNLKKLALDLGLAYLRYVRPAIDYGGNVIRVGSYEEACDLIQGLEGTFFFTTGVNKAEDFIHVQGDRRFVFRVLPVASSIEKLRDLGLELRNIYAGLGPFSAGLNKEMLLATGANYLVTKESGKDGGFYEKLQGAEAAGALVIVIDREEEEGLGDISLLIKEIYKIIE